MSLLTDVRKRDAGARCSVLHHRQRHQQRTHQHPPHQHLSRPSDCKSARPPASQPPCQPAGQPRPARRPQPLTATPASAATFSARSTPGVSSLLLFIRVPSTSVQMSSMRRSPLATSSTGAPASCAAAWAAPAARGAARQRRACREGLRDWLASGISSCCDGVACRRCRRYPPATRSCLAWLTQVGEAKRGGCATRCKQTHAATRPIQLGAKGLRDGTLASGSHVQRHGFFAHTL